MDPHRAQAVALAALRLRNRFARDELAPYLAGVDADRAAGASVGAAGASGARAAGINLLGLRFPNRVGLAAGFDKSA
ncbi:MAG TPA: hypothetical protein VGI23_25700, partial [Steroidobacteraceae bacterium]